MFADSFVIKCKVKLCDCYTFACLKYKGKFCYSYIVEIHLLEILRQILWLLHQRFICLNVWKLYSTIFDYNVKLLNKKILFHELWLAQRNLLVIYDYIHGLDKYNTTFQNVKTVLHQNKAHIPKLRFKAQILKFNKDCNFAGRFLINYFSCLYF